MIVRAITAFVIVEMAFDGIKAPYQKQQFSSHESKKNKINVDRYKIRKEQVKKANYKEDCFAQKKEKKQIELYENIYRQYKMKVIYKTTNYEKSEMLVWVHERIEIVGMIEYAEMKSLHKMKNYGMAT